MNVDIWSAFNSVKKYSDDVKARFDWVGDENLLIVRSFFVGFYFYAIVFTKQYLNSAVANLCWYLY